MSETKAYRNDRGNIVGWLAGNIYHTTRNVWDHFYVKGRGYPISVSILDKLVRDGCTHILLKETAKNGERLFLTEIKNYLDMDPFQEEGFDVQKCYPLKKMSEVKKKEDNERQTVLI